MAKSAYPVNTDLTALLEAAGLTVSAEVTALLSTFAEAGWVEFERRTDRRPMLAGTAATRRFDPPTRSQELHLWPTLVTLTSVTYTPTGASATTLTSGTDFTPLPWNYAADGLPISRIRFATRRWQEPLWIGQRGSLYILGTWGYGATIPNDAWLAMAALGCIDALPMLSQALTNGIVEWHEKDRAEKYSTDPLETLQTEWETRVARAVQIYRRITV